MNQGATRERNRRGEGERLRHELLEATASLLAGGTHAAALSLRAVARQAGVSAPSVYLHFADKEALLAALVERETDRTRALVASALASTEDLLERLVAVVRAYVADGLAQPGRYRLLYESPHLAPQYAARAARWEGGGGFTLLTAAVGEAMAAGRVPQGDPARVAVQLWQAIHGVVSIRIDNPTFPWPDAHEDAERLARLVLGDAGALAQPPTGWTPRA